MSDGGGGSAARWRAIAAWGFAVFFLTAGVLHFVAVEAFARIVPPWLPAPEAIVRLTGAMEIAFAAGLAVPRWRRVTGRVLALYLLAVLPANVYMALERIPVAGTVLPDWALWGRVALQFPLIAAILAVTAAPRRSSHKERSPTGPS